MLKQGIYEQIVNEQCRMLLDALDDDQFREKSLEMENSSDDIAQYLQSHIKDALDQQQDIRKQIDLANSVIRTIDSPEGQSIHPSAKELLFVRGDDHQGMDAVRPGSSLIHSTLFTGSQNEPQLAHELKAEIGTSDEVRMLVSFLKWSGFRLIMDDLKAFTDRGGKLKVITTSYMGATDAKVVVELHRFQNTEIRISYDTDRTRLHAKAYLFHRNTGFDTAYIGSSNLSQAALTSGLEWNLKITKQDQREVMEQVEDTFDSYWNSPDFQLYGDDSYQRLLESLRKERTHGSDEGLYLFDIRPFWYQESVLDKLETEREVQHHSRNLVVAATGTGKTVISAFDYKHFREEHRQKSCRLLFVAHREEILKQSLSCFRGVLKDPNFGSLRVGSFQSDDFTNLFVSVQSANAMDLTDKVPPDFYDYIVIDEFHHAAAQSYQRILSYFKPMILLGLTATPERMDGEDILKYFDGRIAAEIRLPEAIDKNLLCPFQYFGVSDPISLESMKWTRGGYDKGELSRAYSFEGFGSTTRAEVIRSALVRYSDSIDTVKALGFCVSVEHAKFMERYFNDHGIPSMELDGDTKDEIRNNAKDLLRRGEVKVLFVVDLFNEGVDIPEINTVLFLRPTESLTIFIQQLGRGLRLSVGKDCLTVLDFIGAANRNYKFAEKFGVLLESTNRGIREEMEDGFVAVPKGCYIALEKEAMNHVLDNIRGAVRFLRSTLVNDIRDNATLSPGYSLSDFLTQTHQDVRVIYKKALFSRLCAEAGKRNDFTMQDEQAQTKAFLRLCLIDSRRWIAFLQKCLSQSEDVDSHSCSPMENAMLEMFNFTMVMKEGKDAINTYRHDPILKRELSELLACRMGQIDFIDKEVTLDGYESPLDLHCSYSRDQILSALGYYKPDTVRQGVCYLTGIRCDVLFVTLQKSEGQYTPSTMYKDYAINDRLFHWQSQSTTSSDSPTGQRYIHHEMRGSDILLFVRDAKQDVFGRAEEYSFLGKVRYRSHEGSKPMDIVWELEESIPTRYLPSMSKTVVG